MSDLGEPATAPGLSLHALRALEAPVIKALASLRGRVLDLGLGLKHLHFYRFAPEVTEVVVCGTRVKTIDVPLAEGLPPFEVLDQKFDLAEIEPDSFDSVVSIFRMPAMADIEGALERVKTALVDDGAFAFVEPVVGWRRSERALARLTPHLAPTKGLHLDRDVPYFVRQGGLAIIDWENTTLPTFFWPYRHVVRAYASTRYAWHDLPDGVRRG